MCDFDFIEMKIPAKAEYVAVVRLNIAGIANRMKFDYDAIEDLKVAISEATSNVVTHAYENEGPGEITLGFGIYKDKLEIMVSDRGDSFSFNDIKNNIGPIDNTHNKRHDQIREGGFGLFLINALMDKVEINNNYGVTIYMTKYLDKVGVRNNDEVSTT